MRSKKKFSLKMFVLVVAMLTMVFPNSVFASDQYSNNGTTYSSLPSPSSECYWEYYYSTGSSTSTSYDGSEEVHVTLTANLAGNVNYEGNTFNVGFSGTAECTFVRTRYDSWKNCTKVHREMHLELDTARMIAWQIATGNYVVFWHGVPTGRTANQTVTHEWDGHVYGSWTLSSAYKR